MRFSSMILMALLAVPVPALAQTEPFVTEQATTGPAGRLSLETAAAFMASEPNFRTGLERGVWDVPLLRIVYSPAAKVEMDLEWVGCILAVNDPTYGTVAGFGDVTLRSKLLLLDQSPGQPALGVRFTVSLPETPEDEGLGPNTLRMSAQMLLTQDFGSTSLDLNAGFATQDVPLQESEQSDFLAYGVAVRHRLGSRLEGGIEVAGLLGKGQPGADQRGEVRVGIRYGSGRGLWTASLRHGLMESDGTWGATLGFTWTARPGKAPSDDMPSGAPAAR